VNRPRGDAGVVLDDDTFKLHMAQLPSEHYANAFARVAYFTPLI
jgi:hypothetical protein